MLLAKVAMNHSDKELPDMYCTRVFKIVEYFRMQLKCSEDLDELLLKQWRGFAGRESATRIPAWKSWRSDLTSFRDFDILGTPFFIR